MTHCPRCGKTNPAEIHTCTPLALVLADALDATHPALWPYGQEAADELRRLHAENEGQAERIQDIYKQLNDTEKEVDDLRLLLRQALEALEIGHEYAYECAETYHVEMRGYRHKRHDAMDAEVKQIAETIAAIKERLK